MHDPLGYYGGPVRGAIRHLNLRGVLYYQGENQAFNL